MDGVAAGGRSPAEFSGGCENSSRRAWGFDSAQKGAPRGALERPPVRILVEVAKILVRRERAEEAEGFREKRSASRVSRA